MAMSQVLCPPKILIENFPNDREYTFEALVEQLGLIELHIRDGSWRLCSCNPEKHLPLVAGLTSEGFGFAETDDERHFMECSMGQSRLFKAKIKSGKYRTQKHMNIIKDWARELRHRIEAEDWRREKDIEDQMNYEIPRSVLQFVEDLEEIGFERENRLSLPDIEEEMAHKMVKHLCDKHNIPMPKSIVFTDSCNPLIPNAAHIQRDQMTKKGVVNRADLDELVFCRGGVTAFAVAHEFDHYRSHFEGKMVADEGEANRFAIKEVRNNLYTSIVSSKVHIEESVNNLNGKSMVNMLTKAQSDKGLTVVGGLTAAKLVSEYDPQITALLGPLGTQIGKIGVGALAAYYGLTKVKGTMGDLLLFAGAEMALDELFKMFALGGTTIRAPVVIAGAPVAMPLIPGRAEIYLGASSTIRAAAPFLRTFSTPTRLTSGYPQVAQADGKFIQIRV